MHQNTRILLLLSFADDTAIINTRKDWKQAENNMNKY